jgi:phasin family protein
MQEQFKQTLEEALEPLHRLTQLTLEQAEKTVNFQVDAARAYTEFGVEQMRGALTITDTVSLHDYLSKQQDTFTTLTRKLTDDAQTLAGFGKEFVDGAGDVARDGFNRTPNPAAAALGGKRAA